MTDSLSKCTNGEWKADKNLGCKRISAKERGRQKQEKRSEICYTVGMHDEKEDSANALLMAAAKELAIVARLSASAIAAAQNIVGEECGTGMCVADPDDVAFLNQFMKARAAALKKAGVEYDQ